MEGGGGQRLRCARRIARQRTLLQRALAYGVRDAACPLSTRSAIRLTRSARRSCGCTPRGLGRAGCPQGDLPSPSLSSPGTNRTHIYPRPVQIGRTSLPDTRPPPALQADGLQGPLRGVPRHARPRARGVSGFMSCFTSSSSHRKRVTLQALPPTASGLFAAPGPHKSLLIPPEAGEGTPGPRAAHGPSPPRAAGTPSPSSSTQSTRSATTPRRFT